MWTLSQVLLLGEPAHSNQAHYSAIFMVKMREKTRMSMGFPHTASRILIHRKEKPDGEPGPKNLLTVVNIALWVARTL